MAQKSTVHRVAIDLCDTDHQVYEQLQMSVARADSETPQRLAARLIAFCLWYEDGIAFTGGVGAGEEPDVWVREPDGRVKVWIEVGTPDPKRLVKAARHCEKVVLLAYGRRVPDWRRESLPLFEWLSNVTIAALDDAFLERLVSLIDRTISWSVTISGGSIYFASGAEQLETELEPLLVPPAKK